MFSAMRARAAAPVPARRARRGAGRRRARASRGRGRRGGRRRGPDRASASARNAIVDLPLPLAPTMASDSPGATVKLTSSSTRMPRSVVSVHVFERRARRAPSASARASGGSMHIDRRVEQLEHATPRHARRRQARIQAHQRLRRREHAHLIGEKRAERAQRQRAVDHARSAVEKHDRRSRSTAACRAARRRSR